MTQYCSIEDAVIALTQNYGVDIVSDTPRFIALLSDYAPNLYSSQCLIRAFARADGFITCVESINQNRTSEAVFAGICEKMVQATNESAKQLELVGIMKRLLPRVFSKNAKPFNAAQLFAEGMNYYRRFPKDKYVPIALLVFEEASGMGHAEASLYIANSYLKGKGVSQDISKGMQYLEKAAQGGSDRATLELSEHLWKGNGISKDVSRAVSYLKELEDPSASFMLAEIYKEHIEYEKSFEYYLKAAQQNHVYAQFAAAIAYATGQGTKRNIQEAKRWLRSAASLGHCEARRKLEELGEKWV